MAASEVLLFPQERRSGAGTARWIPGSTPMSWCSGRAPPACCGSSRRWASSVPRYVLGTGRLAGPGPLQHSLSPPWWLHGHLEAWSPLPDGWSDSDVACPHLCSLNGTMYRAFPGLWGFFWEKHRNQNVCYKFSREIVSELRLARGHGPVTSPAALFLYRPLSTCSSQRV